MGKIIKDGIEYGRGAQNARQLNYDNSKSELKSTNVQDVIDEIFENSGNETVIEITQEQYDALSEEEKMNGTTYYILDAVSDEPMIELTQEEYDALSEEEKMSNTTFFITNPNDENSAGKIIRNKIEYGSTASDSNDIKYDNSNSKLESTNIQDAIDELSNSIAEGPGSSTSNEREITKSEYDALSEEEKMNGTNYFITDIDNMEIPSSTTAPKEEVPDCDLLLTTTTTEFTAYTVNDLSKYKYIMVCANPAGEEETILESTIIPLSLFRTLNNSNKKVQARFSTGDSNGTILNYVIYCYYSSDTEIIAKTSNSSVIIGKVYGIN